MLLFVATTDVPTSDTPVVVSPTSFLASHNQALFRLGFSDLVKGR
jgi:hypothetical protein